MRRTRQPEGGARGSGSGATSASFEGNGVVVLPFPDHAIGGPYHQEMTWSWVNISSSNSS